MADVVNPATSPDPFRLSDFLHNAPDASSPVGVIGPDGSSPLGDREDLRKELTELAQIFAQLMKALEGNREQKPAASDPSDDGMGGSGFAPADASPDALSDAPSGAPGGAFGGAFGGGPMTAPPIENQVARDLAAQNLPAPQSAGGHSLADAAPPGAPPTGDGPGAAGSGGAGPTDAAQATTSAGAGPNTTVIKNTSTHDEKIGEFLNGGSTTTPAAEIDLKPGQTGALRYQNGQGGFDAEANSQGQFESTASRLEFFADKNGRNNDDVSYIDGENAAIAVNDGHGRSSGSTKSLAAEAPSDIVTKDAGGLPTITGDYDNSTAAMREGAQFLQKELNGTGEAYIHPEDDRNGPGQNPMTMAQDSQQTYYATFGNA